MVLPQGVEPIINTNSIVDRELQPSTDSRNIKEFPAMIIYCITYNKPHSNPKFCSRSCAATHNNKGVRRHGKSCNNCKTCNKPTTSSRQTFCSHRCAAASRKVSEEQKRARNAAAQSAYRAKQYRLLDPTASKNLIKEMYVNCPAGYEVDHIVPLSLGGKHHENNLQYLLKKHNRSKNNHYIG